MKIEIKNRPASEIPTADLIAELERRRPKSCAPCVNKSHIWFCASCFWGLPQPVKGMNNTDNFKESKL